MASSVVARLADLDAAAPALRALDQRARVGASVRAWREAVLLLDDDERFARLAERMPTAAHAVLNGDGNAVTSAPALLASFRQTLSTRAALRSANVQAELRPYQVRGVTWLNTLVNQGIGGVLADEMGLGKSLQAICLLVSRPPVGPHLVVCPTSLLGNWRRELARFVPDTTVVVHHGPGRRLPPALPPGTVVITSYPLLRHDEPLTTVGWDIVILDEAQQIKNPEAMASRAAARLPATARIAMTGTPVENNLDELWSIVNVINPGLLGTRARFRQRFVVPIEQRRSARAVATLRTIVRPNLLRRTKDEVATDLPPKLHSTVVCTLTDEQILLYRRAVDRAFGDGLGTGFERSGRVLALVTALKQICNHPAQFLGGTVAETGRSGKFDRAVEMLTEIAKNQDRALVFTQYRAMGELLAGQLTEMLGAEAVPFLHGGLSAARRDDLVRAFQEDDSASPILLVSLRAAGFGLNLTRAAHVMHYDRWWNPAVEDQATDRAHRIGQQRSLSVYTLVTGGTIEDHIARMHAAKRGLAGVVSADDAEGALTRMPDDELHAVLDLDAGAFS
ncbi:DEAD/DEAH box helicase [Micromonospora sediminicola]|uniref:DEAD/DEAH box helicase n=1 Tax=Micromonospora sediminicola TaxID=946078 RepID=UPI0033A7DCA5